MPTSMRGYEQLSHLAFECPELLMLRRFDKLSVRLLLRLQAELLYLESELEVATVVDESHDPELATYWGKTRESEKAGNVLLQTDKFKMIEQKLKTYRKIVY